MRARLTMVANLGLEVSLANLAGSILKWPYAIHYKTTPPSMDNFKLDPLEPSCATISEYLKAVKERFAFVEEQTKELKKKEQLNQEIKTGRTDNMEKLQKGNLIYVLAPERSNLYTQNKKIKLSYVGPFIIYEVLDDNNILIMDPAGRLMKNIYSRRRIKHAYIRDKQGKTIATRDELLESLKINEHPQAPEITRALMEENLIFTDEHGRLHDKPEGFNAHTEVREGPLEIIIPGTKRRIRNQGHYKIWLDSLSKEECMLHCHQEQIETRNSIGKSEGRNEYNAVKGRFKDGKLQMLLKEEIAGKKGNSFYMDLDESTNNAGLFEMIKEIRITGKPIKWMI
jgi:hypothetical protein